MIHLGYLGEFNEKNIEGKTLCLIVRKPMGNIPRGFMHMPELSPSLSILARKDKWRREEYTLEELNLLYKDGKGRGDWFHLFAPEFKQELAGVSLAWLKGRENVGVDTYLVCYCKDLHSCHRKLVGEYLEEAGLGVDYGENEPEGEIQFFGQISLFSETFDFG